MAAASVHESLEQQSPVALQVAEHTEQARKAAGSLVRADFTEVRALKALPDGVLDLLRVVMHVLTHEPCNLEWADLKKDCADPKFAQRLKDFQPETMTEADLGAVAAMPAVNPKAKGAFTAKLQKWLHETNLAALREAVVEVDPSQPLGMKLTRTGSVFIVTAGGQFERAGIRRGDRVVGLGSIRCSTSDEFAASLKLYKAAGDATVRVVFKEPQARRSTKGSVSTRASTKLAEASELSAATTGGGAAQPKEKAPHTYLRRQRPPPPPKGIAGERSPPQRAHRTRSTTAGAMQVHSPLSSPDGVLDGTASPPQPPPKTLAGERTPPLRANRPRSTTFGAVQVDGPLEGGDGIDDAAMASLSLGGSTKPMGVPGLNI